MSKGQSLKAAIVKLGDQHREIRRLQSENVALRHEAEIRDYRLGIFQSELKRIRDLVIAGGECPAEQYESLSTFQILATRWIPSKEHNERVLKMIKSVDDARSAAEVLMANWNGSQKQFDEIMERFPWLQAEDGDAQATDLS